MGCFTIDKQEFTLIDGLLGRFEPIKSNCILEIFLGFHHFFGRFNLSSSLASTTNTQTILFSVLFCTEEGRNKNVSFWLSFRVKLTINLVLQTVLWSSTCSYFTRNAKLYKMPASNPAGQFPGERKFFSHPLVVHDLFWWEIVCARIL